MEQKLRTPISYYGGKQQMLKYIMPNIPQHNIYTESFVGGGALYWSKEPAKLEVINDINREVVNFYNIFKNHSKRLNYYINATMHSRSQYKDALVIYQNSHLFTNVERAWAFWILTNQGFSTMIGSWGFDRTGKCISKNNNKKMMLCDEMASRLENTTIECNDANRVLKLFDTEETFHYIDPPYINADQGHYSGYTEECFKKLLDTISALKGKFLLSSYPSTILTQYISKCGWYSYEISMQLCASNKKGAKKIEVLTSNYPLVFK